MKGSIFLSVALFVTVAEVHGYEQCAKLWIKRGCYRHVHNDLHMIFDERGKGKVDWDDLEGYEYDLACRCRREALAIGFEWFAIHKYGICLGDRGNLTHYFTKQNIKTSPNCVSTKRTVIVSDKDGEICFGGEYEAYFYQIIKDDGHIASSPQNSEEMEAEEEAIQCTHKSDVILVIDTSGSIGEHNFNFMRGFFLKFLNRYDFSTSRLGIVTFDDKCYVNLMWRDSKGMTVQQLKTYVNEMKYTGGSTMTDNALKCARDKIIKSSQIPGVPVTIFCVTDGASFRGEERIPPIVKELNNTYHVNMISIGIGSEIKKNQLSMIAGNDPDKVFHILTFKDLLDGVARYLNEIISKGCV